MQPLDPTIKSTWLTPTQTAITKGNAKLLQDKLADDATLADQLKTWQLEINSNSTATVQEPLKKAFALWMKDAGIPTSIQTILAKDPTVKPPSYITDYLALDPKDPASVDAYKAQLTKDFGGLKTNKGQSLINTDLIDAVASGSADFNDLGNQIITAVQTATTKSLGPSASQFSDITDSPTYKSLLNDPSKLVDSYNSNVSKLTKDATTGDGSNTTTTTTPPSGVTSLLPKGSFKDANGNFAYTGGEIEPDKMTEFTQSYNPNKGVYRAPSLDASGKLVSNSTSPYSNILNGMLSGYKNPYAADYTNQLKMPETPDLTNIKKSFENNPTSKDLLKLANTAGQPYDPKAITSLSPALSKIYQPSITNSAGQQAKPGAPNTTNTTLPVVPITQIKDGSTAIPDWKRLGYTSEAAYVDDLAKKATADAKKIADEKAIADAKRIADEKAIADAKATADAKAAADKALLSKYNFNNYVTPETRAALASNSDFYKSIATTTPGVADQIKYSNLIDSLSGNTGITTTTAGSLQGASDTANKYNPTPTPNNGIATNTTPYTVPSKLTAAQQYWAQNGNAADQAAIAAVIRQDQLNAADEARNRAAMTASAGANNGIATNIGGFTTTGNMNTNATGTNGASSIVSLLPGSSTPVNNTPQTIYGVDPNQANLTMAPNNPAASANDYGQYKDIKAAVAGGMTQDQINAMDRDRNMRAMGLIP
jgi:hypothetical protein